MSRILMIDDALDDQLIVTSQMGRNVEVVCASSLSEARLILARKDFDLILLDVALPDGDGFQYCASLQSEDATCHIPLIFLTARKEIEDKILGFSLGAEDYVTKPFDPKELRTRIEAKIRKSHRRKASEVSFQVGDIKINISQQKACVQRDQREQKLDLTPLEFRLLCYFARHEDHVFSRDQLLTAIWADNVNVLDRTVDMHVSNLRKKLTPSLWTLRSVHGVGYRLTRSNRMPIELGEIQEITP